jgi:hypothetical protein
MKWIYNSKNFKYLKNFYENIDPEDEDQIIFKESLNWAISTIEEQASALTSIEQELDIGSVRQPPILKVIQGGKK